MTDHTCALRKADGGVDCWGNDEYGKATPPAGVSFKQITAGENHTCGIKLDGNVACWGGNTWGQAPDYRAGPDSQISAGDLFTCAVRARQRRAGLLGVQLLRPGRAGSEGAFTQVAGGGGHACAIRADGNIACWGTERSRPGDPADARRSPPFAFEGFYAPVEPPPT